ncbi:MAG TPA: hypothetical protein DCZ08_00390 [Anaerolineaceae bacterium]|nr:hypothetical protein [Anaerolineaceae bacterium]
MDWQTILSVLGGLTGIGSFISVIVLTGPQRRKIKAEAKHLEASAKHEEAEADEHTLDGAFKLLDKMKDQMAIQDKKYTDLEYANARFKIYLGKALKRIEYLMQGITRLIEQLESNLIKPVWRPDDWNLESEDDK